MQNPFDSDKPTAQVALWLIVAVGALTGDSWRQPT